ncbi:MAG: DUF3224 domain-containing protein [Flavobacteriales bacterium]
MEKITGTFEVRLTPQDVSYSHGTTLHGGRLNIDKTFEGPLSGSSHGEMLSMLDAGRSAGGYVAVEIFEGSVNGKSGSFALQHYGKTDSTGQSLILEVVPGTGEGDLRGIRGSMNIRIESKQHFYDFEFAIP